MLRLSLILTLAVVQLLVGSGNAVYLCVSSDGKYCFDSGPLSCTCCHHQEDSDSCEHLGCDAATESCENGCCCHHRDQSPSDSEQSQESEGVPTLATGECNCTHELVSNGHYASSPRATVGEQLLHSLQHMDCLPSLVQQPLLNEWKYCLRWQGPPPLSDVAISILSTVVIRC